MYNIPEDAYLIKEGLYRQDHEFQGHTLIRLYAAEGYAIYAVDVPEEERIYAYSVYLAINDSVDRYDVVLVEPGMEVVGKPNSEEVV